jgi:hypothetical protein
MIAALENAIFVKKYLAEAYHAARPMIDLLNDFGAELKFLRRVD